MASRMDSILQGLAHRQHAGLSMHALATQDLDARLAQIDRDIAAETSNLQHISEEAGKAEKEVMELAAEYKQVCGTLKAEKTENAAMRGSIEKSQKQLQEKADEEEKGMLKFLEMSDLLNANFGMVQATHPGAFFDVGNQSSPDKETATPSPGSGDESMGEEED